MMKERPIIFSGLMVRAILEGRKSQTRRIVKPQPDAVIDGEPYWHIGGYRASRYRGVTDQLRMGTHNPIRCPYGIPGDRLWVRESFFIPDAPYKAKNSHLVSYKADETNQLALQYTGWRPSIHMPRWASRIILEIVEIRVERVQDISEADALAEGVSILPDAEIAARVAEDTPARMEFWALWTSIHGPDSWDANPWVWVLEFRRVA